MRRIGLLALAILTTAACAEATSDEGVHIEDTPAAIEEQQEDDEFRAYANLIATDSEGTREFSFYLDELHDEESSWQGCVGQVVSICGPDEFAYCHEGAWLGVNTHSPIPPAYNCQEFPDEWEAYHRLNCAYKKDMEVRIQLVAEHYQGDYTQPAPNYFGEPVTAPTTDGSGTSDPGSTDPSEPSTTDGTTQPSSGSGDTSGTSGTSGGSGGSGYSGSTGTQSGGGGSSTSQPGQL